MYPETLGEVVFREAYAAQGPDAPVYLVAEQWDGLMHVYPKDHKQRNYTSHDPNALCPPDMDKVPPGKLRELKSVAQNALQAAVCDGKYRTIAKLLRHHPLLDPHGAHDMPSLFHALSIDDTERWRKTVEVLVKHGARLDHGFRHSNCDGWTLAHEAVKQGAYERLDALHEMGVPLQGMPSSMDLLDVAIRQHNYDAMGALLLRGFTQTQFQAKLPSLASGFDRFNAATYAAVSAGGITLPVPHMALLRHYTQPEHLQAVMDAISGSHHWNAICDHHGRTALEMAEHLGGAVAERGLQLKAHLEHDTLQRQVPPPKASASGRRL